MNKGFIEVTGVNNKRKILVNIKWIECIEDSTIYFVLNVPNAVGCEETYEEIK